MPRTLVVAASEREGLGLVDAYGLHRVNEFRLKAGDREQALGLYRGEFCDLLLSGVLEHHMVAATALALQHLTVDYVVNFGACGTYGDRFTKGMTPEIGDTVGVSVSCRFDVADNLHWAPPRPLPMPDNLLTPATCVTGSRYSTPSDYESEYFPAAGDVEDMELYGLCVLLESLGKPLYSIKFVTNEVGPAGREQFRANVVPVRDSAQAVLTELLHSLKSAARATTQNGDN